MMERHLLRYFVAAGVLLAAAGGVCGGVKPSFLPYERELEYIENDGNCYFDTGIVLTNDVQVEIEFSLLAATPGTGTLWGIFGARNTASSRNISISQAASNILVDFQNVYYDDVRCSFNNADTAGQRYKAVMRNSARSLFRRQTDGSFTNVGAKEGSGGSGTYNSEFTAYIFNLHNPGDNIHPMKGRIYKVTIFRVRGEEKEIIYEYIPVLANGVPCLYETVTKTFPVKRDEGMMYASPGGTKVAAVTVEPSRTNAEAVVCAPSSFGDGASACNLQLITSTAAAWVSGAPYEHALTYLEGDGNAYIDLGYKMNQDMSVELEYEILDVDKATSTQVSYGLFGARKAANEKNISVTYAITTKNGDHGTISVDFNNGNCDTYRASMAIVADPGRMVVTNRSTLRAVSRVATSSGAKRNTAKQTTAFETANNAWLFGANGSGFNFAKARIYLCKVYRLGELIHDYQPCEKDGVACLYDRVTGEFKRNSGAGAFALEEAIRESPKDFLMLQAEPFSEGARVWTNNLGAATTPGAEFPFTLEPLQPGSRYGYYLIADNGLEGGVARYPENGFLTFNTLEEEVISQTFVLHRASSPQRRKLKALVNWTAEDAERTKVYAVAGADYGGTDDWGDREWEVGEIGPGETELILRSRMFEPNDRYLRLRTEGGEWSRTVLLEALGWRYQQPATMFYLQ